MHSIVTTLATEVASRLKNKQLTLCTAESCTGGGLAYALTAIPGSSNWFEGGLITYSNQAKMSLLNVEANTLATYGAVSAETAREMADGARICLQTNVSIAITGIAGPTGGSHDKPVGTVWIAYALPSATTLAHHHLFSGDREAVRTHTIETALQGLLRLLI